MSVFTETHELQSLEIFPSLQAINVKWLDTTFKDGMKVNETIQRKNYSNAGIAAFEIEIAPTGDTLANIVAKFSETALTQRDVATASLATVEAAHASALAAKDTEIARLTALIPAPKVDANGVPQSVTRRQAKTVMELTPHPTHGDLWQAALAAANAVPDPATRIITVNYLLESLNFEYPQVLSMASNLMGMTSVQIDALFIAAAKL